MHKIVSLLCLFLVLPFLVWLFEFLLRRVPIVIPQAGEGLLLHSLLVREAEKGRSEHVEGRCWSNGFCCCSCCRFCDKFSCSSFCVCWWCFFFVQRVQLSGQLWSCFLVLGDPNAWSAAERDANYEYVSFGGESLQVLFSERSKLRLRRGGSWHSRADGRAIVLVHVSSRDKADKLFAASWLILTASWNCLALNSRLVLLLCRQRFTLVAHVAWSSLLSRLLTLEFSWALRMRTLKPWRSTAVLRFVVSREDMWTVYELWLGWGLAFPCPLLGALAGPPRHRFFFFLGLGAGGLASPYLILGAMLGSLLSFVALRG